MASTPTRNEEKKSSWLSQTASCLSGGQKVSVSHSEEFLTRISNELTEEALFIAGCHMNLVPTKEKQTKDQGTQISNHGDLHLRTAVSRDPPTCLVPVPDPLPTTADLSRSLCPCGSSQSWP
uniref:Uncharacterized protein n=1 Tax=Sciurus vulgaris TaxID=55149 RepID=A0A8D2DX73_SCIVU